MLTRMCIHATSYHFTICADGFRTTLLTMPFGILQTIAILIGCYCAQKFKIKSAIFAFLMLLVGRRVMDNG